MRTSLIGPALVIVTAIGLSGCADEESDRAAGQVAELTVPVAGDVAFSESFDNDRNKWGVVDDPAYGTTSYADGDYVWAFRGSVAHWLAGSLAEAYDRGEVDMRDVVVRASATIDAGDGVVGVSCRETRDTDAQFQWYEFVARDGFAAIRQADDEGNIEVLARTDAAELPLGTPIELEAACVDTRDDAAQLSLSLNGTPVLQAEVDDPLGNGVPSLQAWTFPIHEQLDVRWHEFSVHRPTG